jgi:ceramide glucosyltransferase
VLASFGAPPAKKNEAHQPPDLSGVRVLLVRPCAGFEPHLLRNLESPSTSHFSFDLEVCITTCAGAEGALPMARRAAQKLRAEGISCSIRTLMADVPNRKAGQLAALMRERHDAPDLVINADSDIDLGGFDLDRLVAPLLGRSAAAVCWAPFVDVAAQTSGTLMGGDRLSASVLRASLQAFPLLAVLDPHTLVGKLCAFRQTAIREIGGFEALSHYIAEDMELSRRLQRAGMRVAVIPSLAHARPIQRSRTDALQRFSRWLTSIRRQRPHLLLSYPLLFTVALPSTLLIAFGAMTTAIGTAALGMAWLSRLLVAFAGRRLAGVQRPFALGETIADLLFAELALNYAFFRALWRRPVYWRGRLVQ